MLRAGSPSWSWRSSAIVASAVFAVVGSACAGFEEPALQAVTPVALTRIVVPPASGQSSQFDVMSTDQEHHLIYASDAIDLGIEVIDIATPPGRYLKTIVLPSEPNGVVYVPELRRVYTGNFDSTVSVIDADPASPHAFSVLKTFSTGGDGIADLLEYDAKDRRLFVTNPDDGFISSIDPATNRVVGRIAHLGAVEQPRYDPVDGMLYAGSSDRNSLLELDPRKLVLVHEFPIPVVCVPHGLAINPAINQGLVGCGDKDNLVTVAWDFSQKRMLQAFDFAGGGDQVIFDEKSQHFYFAADGFSPPELAIFNASPIAFLTAVPTSHHSLDVAYDELHHMIYTVDGKHLEAAIWAFPDPVAGCSGHEAQLASEGAPRSETPHCHPESQT